MPSATIRSGRIGNSCPLAICRRVARLPTSRRYLHTHSPRPTPALSRLSGLLEAACRRLRTPPFAAASHSGVHATCRPGKRSIYVCYECAWCAWLDGGWQRRAPRHPSKVSDVAPPLCIIGGLGLLAGLSLAVGGRRPVKHPGRLEPNKSAQPEASQCDVEREPPFCSPLCVSEPTPARQSAAWRDSKSLIWSVAQTLPSRPAPHIPRWRRHRS